MNDNMNENYNDSLDVRDKNELVSAIAKAQYTTFKSYIHELKDMAVIEADPDIKNMKTEDCIRLLKLKKLTRQKNEDVIQKLTTIYNAVLSTGASLIVMIDAPSQKSPVDIYMGVRHYKFKNEGNNTALAFKTLQAGILSQFPGTLANKITINKNIDENVDKLLDAIFQNKSTISSVSTVASIRNKEKTENKDFIQGIERLIDAMKGKPYTALFIADPITQEERASIRSGIETLYTSLAPFEKSVWSYNENESEAVMKSLSSTVGQSVTEGTSWTQSHTVSHTKGSSDAINIGAQLGMDKQDQHSTTTTTTKSKNVNVNVGTVLGVASTVAGIALPIIGTAIGGPLGTALGGALGKGITTAMGIAAETAKGASVSKESSESVAETIGNSIGRSLGLNASYGHTWFRSDTEGDTTSETTMKNDTKTDSETETESSTETKGTGRTLQIENQNKMITEILQRLDEQLKRMKESEDYGLVSCGAYFISNDSVTSVLAANTYRALLVGEGSSVESSAVNTWDKSDERNDAIKDYLRHFYQPVFACVWDEFGSYMPFSAATNVSGLELPLHLGLPMSSVSGLDVVEHAAFGRNAKNEGDSITLGNLYHMGQDDDGKVEISKKKLTSHTFITGSTGAGKSNAVYQIISQLKEQHKKFLVIEPAKGEYKKIFGGYNDVEVYGTNRDKTKLLKINPFSFNKEIHVLEHIDRLVEIFNACWPMYAAMPAVLKDAIERIYIDKGWDLNYSVCEPRIYPTFYDLLEVLPDIMKNSLYSADTKSDYAGALITRVKSLTNGINGQILCTATNPEDENKKLFDNNVIVDISRVGSTETKSLIMGILIMKLQEYRMCGNEINRDLQHITVLEEAHNLLRRTSSVQTQESSNLQGKSVEMISNAIAEMRTYGEGFIIADQAPGLLDESVIRNTNTKIIFRLPDEDDRVLAGGSAALTDTQISEIAKLPLGVAVVYQNDWIEAVLCQFEKYIDSKEYSYKPVDEQKYLKEYFYKIFSLSDNKELSNETADFIREWIGSLPFSQYTKSILTKAIKNPVNDKEKTEIAYNVFKGQNLGQILQNNSDEKIGLDNMHKSIYNMYNIQDEALSTEIQRIVFRTILERIENTELANRYRIFAEGGRIA